jgi:NUMOD4 motif
MTQSNHAGPPERWEPVPEIDGCTYSSYQACTLGAVRSTDRTAGSRTLRGVTLKARPNNSGYLRVNMSCDNPAHKPHTHTVQKVILRTFAGECPPGMEARHLDNNPRNNCWAPGSEEETRAAGGNLIYGTKPQNHADRPDPAAPPDPQYECRNFTTCGNTVANPGRRCLECLVRVGVLARAMLDQGAPLPAVAGHFGYTADAWTYKLAVEHGGYAGTRARARTQRPTLAQRWRLRRLRRQVW